MEGKKVYLDDPDCAVEQLQAAMKIYDALGLANDPCAAPLFMAYGLALVETARASSDVFGQKMDSIEGAKERLLGPAGDQENRDPKRGGAKGKDGASTSKGRGATAEGEDAGEEEEEEEDGEESEEESEEESKGDVRSDSEMGWEMLEVARHMFMQDGAEKHLLQLCDLHDALSELRGESGDFKGACEELRKGLVFASQAPELDLRCEANLHFKLACALQFDGKDLAGALAECGRALDKLKAAKRALEDKLEPLDEKIQAGDKEAEAALEKGEGQLEGLAACMEAIQEKYDDLEMSVKETEGIKATIANMFNSALGGGGPAAAAAAVAAAKATGSLGGAKAMLAAAAAGAMGGASGSGGAPRAPVQDLGVAGRGRSRITLQPQPVAPKPAAGAFAAGAAVAAAGAAAAAPKRSLQDLMGGAPAGGATVSIGFRSSTAPASASLPAAAAAAPAGGMSLEDMMAKRAKGGVDAKDAPPAPPAQP
ncbi:hypothetical protein FOA52_003902 [Chlamydomonas sp. UWO 241]|nr:hypothetical protein FOA52_003902 [Chlamydomonas sp. UWO 241]